MVLFCYGSIFCFLLSVLKEDELVKYNKLEFLLFKLNEFFNNGIFITIITILIIASIVFALVYDFKNNGPLFSTSNKNNYNRKKEIKVFLFPIIILSLFIFVNRIFSGVDSPNAIVQSSQDHVVSEGKVLWINNDDSKVGIVNKEMNDNNPIIASVNNTPVFPTDSFIPPYGGTTISNQQFLRLSKGNTVKILVREYKWKYSNHDDFADSNQTKNKIDLLNNAKVNGMIEKK